MDKRLNIVQNFPEEKGKHSKIEIKIKKKNNDQYLTQNEYLQRKKQNNELIKQNEYLEKKRLKEYENEQRKALENREVYKS